MATRGWTKLNGYQAVWDPDTESGYFYFTFFTGDRERTPNLSADQFAVTIDILRNEDPVYGNSTTGSVTTQGEGVGEGES